MKYLISIKNGVKRLRSENCNYNFNMIDGTMHTWGKIEEDDPLFSPYGPFILDIEVTTQCKGPKNSEGKHVLCPFCYKNNNPNGQNMSFETFKTILDKMPPTLTQIAFGVDAQAESNADLWKMMEYARSKNIIPNLTVADISDEVADKIASLAGACAVSRYEDKNTCYNSVKKLTDRGMKQVNIHCMISDETYNRTVETMLDMINDERLKGMYALVMLSLKQKGRGTSFNPLKQIKFNALCSFAHTLGINFGFDSCGSSKYLRFLDTINIDDKERKLLTQSVEPCEVTKFSSYINTNGEYFPCSFMEGHDDWITGIDVVSCNSFIEDVWHNNKVKELRNKMFTCNRPCLFYNI